MNRGQQTWFVLNAMIKALTDFEVILTGLVVKDTYCLPGAGETVTVTID
jgi:hypothetical protein